MNRVYVLGSINVDLVIEADRFPKQGETILGNRFFVNFGGKGANQAVAASKMKKETYMIGSLGNDHYGNDAINQLKKENVRVDHVSIKHANTGVASIWLTKNDNRIILDLGANLLFHKDEIDQSLIQAKKDDVFITQLEIPLDIVEYGLKKAKEKKLFTIFNPAPYQSFNPALLNYVDLLILNETEYEAMINEDYQNLPLMILTKGKEGAVIIQNNHSILVPGFSVKAIDTTGAGDTFVGAIASQYPFRENLEDVVRFANAAGALSVLKYGAQESIPKLSQVRKFLEENKND